MKYLLDTNICIYIIKQKPPAVQKKFGTCSPGDICISSITVAELQYGVQKSNRLIQNQQALDQFLLPLNTVNFSLETSLAYGKIRADLERAGTPIGPLDTLIAAHALALNLTIVTNNVREFERVPDLAIENWAET